MKRELGILLVAAGLVAGCGSKASSCVPGQSAACACSDGSTGAQVCGGNGAYGACDCAGGVGVGGNGGGGGGGTGGTGGSGGGGGANVGPGSMSIANASARMVASGNYSMSFVLDNAKAGTGYDVNRIDIIRFSWGSTTLTWSEGCGSTPWVTSQSVSNVINITLLINPAQSGAATAYVPCGSTSDNIGVGNAPTMPSSAITIDVEGIMADAAPFKVTATAPLL